MSEEHVQKIAAAARDGIEKVFKETFEKAGIPVVTTPGKDVLRMFTGVANLYINAPDTMSAGRSRTYTTEAGEATLVLEVRDSTHRRSARPGARPPRDPDTGGVEWTTSVSNRADFSQLFKQWANICVKGFEELKAQSPVPTDLQPNQNRIGSLDQA